MMGESWEWIMARNEREGGKERGRGRREEGGRERGREREGGSKGERRESVLTYISHHECSP